MQRQFPSNTESLLKLAVYAFTAVFPLLFTSATVESFEFPKTIFLYLVVPTLVIWLFILKKGPKKRPAPAVIAFVGTYALATVLSSHVYTSIWGYYSRFNGGLISVLCFFGLYFVIINLFSKQDMLSLKKLLVIGSVPVSLYAIYQHVEFNLLGTSSNLVRVYSTIGQPNWLGAYLASICMLVFGFVLLEKTRMWFLYAIIFVFAFAGLWFSFSLSSLFGFIVGLAYWLVGVREVTLPNWKKILVVSLACLAIVIVQPGIWGARLQDAMKTLSVLHSSKAYAQQNESLTKSQATNFALSDSGVIRKGIWKGTLAIFSSSPKNVIVGTGPETFPYEFQKHRPAELNYSSEWDYILNKPHNYYLEMLVVTGLIGFAAYVWWLSWIFAKGQKTSRPAFLVIFVTNVFSWPVSVINLLLWELSAENEID